jgi:alpha-N-arabinofuranosidase
MRSPLVLFTLLLAGLLAEPFTFAREIDVSVNGNDANDGSAPHPFKTISAAAQVARPGDVVTVQAGIYRERIDPPRGGTSDDRRIVYQAAPGEKVEIAGSEEVRNWVQVQGDTWEVSLPNAFFGDFNPYSETIHGDWFKATSRQHNPGAVYLNGVWLNEAATMAEVTNPTGQAGHWFAQVDAQNTTITAQFKGVDPNKQEVEINVRQAVFYPKKTGINYITVRGFTLRDAATPWAPPTAEQIALIGTHWSKGWIIENNVIKNSTCSGVSLGKYGDEFDNKAATPDAYDQTIARALKNGWNGENIGHHIVRNNTIFNCGQGGIVGSLGAIFSEVIGNHIYNIANSGQINGDEQAGIKFHAAIDVLIKGNRIHDCKRGMWMDWMAQGTRISGNLCYHNGTDIFLEVDHGPFLLDNNFLLSPTSIMEWSEGGAYVHNLVLGSLRTHADKRSTPYFQAHSTVIAGTSNIQGGDDRFFNNIFGSGGENPPQPDKAPNSSRFGLATYDTSKFPLQTGGNVYTGNAQPYAQEAAPVQIPSALQLRIIEDGDHVRLQINLDDAINEAKTTLVTTALLGNARVPNLPFENPDGSPLEVDTDYFGKKRDPNHPTPGPIENPGSGEQTIQVW